MTGRVIYSVVVPVYNEEEVVAESVKRLTAVMNSTKKNYELIFVNDGSRDNTKKLLQGIRDKNKKLKIIDFSRNFGHQIAITAGMDYAEGEAVLIIDADLQDPPEVMLEMIKKWEQGYDVVYGKRKKRKGETIFKLMTAKVFYRFLSGMTQIKIPKDVGDFRLLDRKVCDAMCRIHERNRFVRGLISWAGYNQAEVPYVREKRYAGKTKYPFIKMIRFALNAIVSFSYKPLRLASLLGVLVSLGGFGYLIYVIFQFFNGETVPGWTSLISLSLIFNGIILMILGIIGEYIGRIYDESKARPLYLINELIGFKAQPRSKRGKNEN
ncbi:MAG: glycosyltransferase family 2 protein [Spirochaetales bacterium]|nr:glycosyltransferase family 2 protein [Spirochaetales bacterium]